MSKPLRNSLLFLALVHTALFAQAVVEVVPARAEAAKRTLILPGEILPYEQVTLHARVNGYVDRVLVDRGSVVKEGQLLATLSAPELEAQTSELEARVQAAESARAEAGAQLAGAQATYDRLKIASATPGAIAGNELIQAEKRLEAARAIVQSSENAARAAASAVSAAKQMQSYLNLTAPFSGVITDRYVHPGALVGPGNGSAGAMLQLEQISRLRLVVPVPELNAAGIRIGAPVEFRVPAYPDKTFTGIVARIDRALDPKTRTMSVELDVRNTRNELSPGMYPEVSWPATAPLSSLVVPQTAVVTTTEHTFVIRVRNGRAEWVDVRKGPSHEDTVEILGKVAAGDLVIRQATDEIRDGSAVTVRSPKAIGRSPSPATDKRQSPAPAARIRQTDTATRSS
jgi:membrane fusion protein, multidrug efflux system